MTRKATIEDRDFINSVIKADYDLISDDGSAKDFDCEKLLPYFLIVGDNSGAIMMLPHNYVTYEQHTCIKKEFRKKTVNIVHDVWEWVFKNTPCQKIITNVPSFNRAANIMAIRVGFKLIGINTKSFLKNGVLYNQYFYGVEKGDVCQ